MRRAIARYPRRPHDFSPAAEITGAVRGVTWTASRPGTCRCGYGPAYRAHQPLGWRMIHPFRYWR